MASRIERIEKMLHKRTKKREKGASCHGEHSTIKEESNNIINGVDVSRIPAKDEYAYGHPIYENRAAV